MTPAVGDVRFEHHREPSGIGEAAPRISWTVRTDRPGWMQRAYQLAVDDGTRTIETERIESAASVLAPWPSDPLPSRARRTVRVRVWGFDDDEPSPWSEPAAVETGLLDSSDWSASMISPVDVPDPDTDSAPAVFRHEFDVAVTPVSARLYVTAHGVLEARINGTVVGNDVLAPGWSSYTHRLRYFTYDVTDLLTDGPNVIGATVADGWYRGLLGFEGGRRTIYGDRLGLLAQLEIRFSDGTMQTVGTDPDWRVSIDGPIRSSGLYHGETYDAREALVAWDQPGYDCSEWSTVVAEHAPTGRLVAPPGPPVRRIDQLAPVSITTSPSGKTLVDFGQNLVGRLRIRVDGPAGQTITLRHAEVLEDGELGTRPLRVAKATDRYIADGTGPAVWEPAFTFHGFRYAEIDGWPGTVDAADLSAIVLHTDMVRTGWFSCSDELVDQLHRNVVWGMRGNFLDLPTDCPQRDERLGWTGDIQVFAPTAAYLYDCTGMLSSWLSDLAAEQVEIGTVPVYVPFIQLKFPAAPAAAWGDAAVMVPWALYRSGGDADLLRRQYPSMRAWVEQVAELAGPDHLWNTGLQLGDWLDPSAPPDQPAKARTDAMLVATAYHFRSTAILGSIAEVLGEDEDRLRYGDLARSIASAFRSEYVSPSGRLVSDAPTAYALAIVFGLLEPAMHEHAGRRLVELVRADDHRIGTGFVGTPIICDALCAVGAADTAYHLLTQRECPSWLYPVTMGATTIWERWDSILPDGSINPGDMTSFNHYALGAVADWLHRTVAGLAPTEPGYRSMIVAPRPGGGLTWARAAHDTPYGRAEVAWERTGSALRVTVTVPPNTSAEIRLPDSDQSTVVRSGTHVFSAPVRPADEDPPMPLWDPFAAMTGG